MKEKGRKFEFQTYMQKHGIKKRDLPEPLARMIKIFEKHLKEVMTNCDQEYCIDIYSKFQKDANFIMNEIFEFMEERTIEAVDDLSEIQDEAEKVKEEPVLPTDEEILADLYSKQRLELSRKDLKALGFSTQFNTRKLSVGNYKLERPLMHSMWVLSKILNEEA